MVKFRNVNPAADAFVDKAKTAEGQGAVVSLPQTRVAQPVVPDTLNPRVMRQVNISMAETTHFELKMLCQSLPNMSMQKFILEAVTEKVQRVTAGQGGVVEE